MELEKKCDFCSSLRPIVYCSADTANLCLPCDARVHSANALSSRHLRTVVCEACRWQLASVRCFDHRMFMCRGCNISLHDLFSNHPRKPISDFTGCPSAGNLAELWGFDLNQLEDHSRSLSGSGSSSVSEMTSTGLITLPNVGPRGQYVKAPDQQDKEGHILQQILCLKKIQMNQGSGDSSLVRGQREMDISSIKHNAKQMPLENLDQQLHHSLVLDSNPDGLESLYVEPISDSFPTILPQLEGDLFWPSKSPLQSGQLWTQNMQDLGVCDDPGCLDGFSMPDVDLTFKNIEEIFGGDQELDRALLDEAPASSSRKMEMSIDKFERSVEDVSAASSTYMSYSDNVEKNIDSSEKVNVYAKTKGGPKIAESRDSGQSSDQMRQNLSHSSTDPENSNVDAKQRALRRFKEKKKIRMSEKQARFKKARSEVKKLVKSNQFTKA